MSLVGQRNLISRLQSLVDGNTVPHTIIFIAPRGHGKRTVMKWLADKMGASLYVPENLKVDSIRDIILDSKTLSSRKLYLLADAEEMTNQAQNALLKLAEEPPQNGYIGITVADENSLLPTILSRSVVFRLDAYDKEELKSFTDNETLLDIAENPGMIQTLQGAAYEELLKHCEKVVDNIAAISAANAFNILRYIDKEKYHLLIPMLLYVYQKKLLAGRPVYKQIIQVYQTKRDLDRSKSINVQNALEMMFVKLREVARSEQQ